MQTRVIDSITEIDSESWNSLLVDGNPCLRHEFLATLELSGCTGALAGWRPNHLLCFSGDAKLVGALPLYLKSNSYGEFVFDFSWANAYHQAGLNYYPKLVSAIPFTPITGPRLLATGTQSEIKNIHLTLLAAAKAEARAATLSSLHVLFPDAEQTQLLASSDMLLRKDCQFHWYNKDYQSFDDFLAGFTASKRKKTRRERRRIKEAGIVFEARNGDELSPADWDKIMPLYSHTFLRRGREPYLNQEFFLRLSQTLPAALVVFMGFLDEELVATAICFRSDTTLYGRYWGASRFIDSLHFETCYYQGIEYCIKEGLQFFEPGTQGEHKISRGFVPTETWSAHWLAREDFAQAIDAHLQQERQHIDQYIIVAGEHIPYRSKPS